MLILFANILSGLAFVLSTLLSLYFWIVIVACLLTWVRPDPFNPIVRTLSALTEPVFYRVRKAFPFTLVNGFDLSPVLVLVAIQLVEIVVVQSLNQYAVYLRT